MYRIRLIGRSSELNCHLLPIRAGEANRLATETSNTAPTSRTTHSFWAVMSPGPSRRLARALPISRRGIVLLRTYLIHTHHPPSSLYQPLYSLTVAGRHVPGLLTGNPAHNGFQLFPLAYEIMTSPIPDSLSYEQAVVLPLAISTAAAGLYQHDYLNLPLPPSTTKQNNNKTVLIWGGSSSVGATAVQLATASGLRVITTASSSNFEFVRSLGAAAVFDYKSASVVEDTVSEIKKGGSEFVGVYDAIGEVEKSVAPLAGVLKQLGKLDMQVSSVLPCDKNPYGLKSKFGTSSLPSPPPLPHPEHKHEHMSLNQY